MGEKRKKTKNPLFLIFLFLNVSLFSYIASSLFLSRAEILNINNSKTSLSSKVEAKKIAAFCKERHSIGECYSDEFKKLTQNTDLAFAKKTLSDLQEIEPRHSLGCHLIAHSITIAETRKNPDKWKELFNQVDSNSCTGGYVHGILEAHAGAEPDFEITAQQIPEICSLLPDAHAGGDINCSHNLGHILLAQEDNSIEKAVNICEGVAGEMMKYECLSGIFMERMTRLNLEAHGIAGRIPWNEKTTTEMEQICRKNTGVAGLACWREISHMLAFVSNDEPEKVFGRCHSAPDIEYAKHCYKHAASIMVVSFNFKEENLSKICIGYSEGDPAYDDCMTHAIGGMILSSDKFSSTAIKLCNSSYSTYTEQCFERIGRSLTGVVKSNKMREKICSVAPEDYRSQCANPNVF